MSGSCKAESFFSDIGNDNSFLIFLGRKIPNLFRKKTTAKTTTTIGTSIVSGTHHPCKDGSEPLLNMIPVVISLIVDMYIHLHPCLPGACALFRHRRERKTETSSDASDEAPERARKDAPKEVKLHEGSILFSRLSGEVSQASIRRFPCPQG